MSIRFAEAEDFICSQARLLERLLFDVHFHSADPQRVGRQVAAYQNKDGGLGHALEPDVRCSESQPLYVEVGLLSLRDAGFKDQSFAMSICDFMEDVADDSGLAPILLPSAFRRPRAPHWTSAGTPGLNPNAGICGLLHWQGVEHPWLGRATATCCDLLRADPPQDAHALLSATRLIDHIPNRSLAVDLAGVVARVLPSASFFIPSLPVNGYGLTPLEFAPSPESPWRSLFTDDQITGHLDHLESLQQADGGWPITWDAPGPAAVAEWRGRVTLNALTILAAYGRCTDADVLFHPGA